MLWWLFSVHPLQLRAKTLEYKCLYELQKKGAEMKAGRLKEILEKVDPNMEVLFWNPLDEVFQEVTSAGIEEVYELEDGERVYDENDEPVMREAFCISN